MKKLYKIFASLIFIVSSTLIFFACAENKILTKPFTIGLVHNDIYNQTTNEYEETQILLVTDKNKFASHYRFYITDGNDKENINNYVTFESNTNFVDISDYFDKRRTYHYFVQYIGSKNYKNSDFSEIRTYTPNAEKVNAPYLQIIDEEISWFRIMNAEGYAVYEEITDKNNQTVKNLIQTTNSETFTLNLSNRFTSFDAPYNTYRYSVKALASGMYQNSEESNSVSYIKKVNLKKPSNLRVSKEGNEYYLNWNAVDYATGYQVVINGKTELPLNSLENKFNITPYLTNYSTFSFNVKAKESDVLSYTESEFSDTLIYDYTLKLSAPQSLNVSREGQFLNISWDEVSMAESYTLIIEENGKESYKTAGLDTRNTTIEIKTYFGEITSDKVIKIKVKANAVNKYIFESNYLEVTYTILATAVEN